LKEDKFPQIVSVDNRWTESSTERVIQVSA